MKSADGARLQAEYEAARSRLCPADQVANAPDANYDLTPVSEDPAIATRAKWAAFLPGQAVPLIGEIPLDPYECEPV